MNISRANCTARKQRSVIGTCPYRIILTLSIFSIAIAITACRQASDDTNGQTIKQEMEAPTMVDPRDHIFVQVHPGDNLPAPSEVGADYIITRNRSDLSFVKGLDFATFSARWNQATEILEREDIALTEPFNFRYRPDFASCLYNLLSKTFMRVDFNFLNINVHVDYNTGYVWHLSAGYEVPEGIESIYNHKDIIDQYRALVYAANLKLETKQQWDEFVEELGFAAIEPNDFEKFELKKTIDGYVYAISNQGKNFGMFQISTK